MFVKHFEDEQHHKSAMYYYYYTLSWNILHFLKKQRANQLPEQLILCLLQKTMGKNKAKLFKHSQTLKKAKKKNLWKQSSLFMISIYNAVHSTMHIIWNLNWFTMKYKLISKWELSLPVNTLCIYISTCKSIAFTYHSYEYDINTHAEHIKKYFVERGSRNIFQR